MLTPARLGAMVNTSRCWWCSRMKFETRFTCNNNTEELWCSHRLPTSCATLTTEDHAQPQLEPQVRLRSECTHCNQEYHPNLGDGDPIRRIQCLLSSLAFPRSTTSRTHWILKGRPQHTTRLDTFTCAHHCEATRSFTLDDLAPTFCFHLSYTHVDKQQPFVWL